MAIALTSDHLMCLYRPIAPFIVIAMIALAYPGVVAHAQDMEPRAYSAVPTETNFLVGGYLRTTGSVSLDPSLPIQNIKASINTGILGYVRTFDLFGVSATAGVVVPFQSAQVSGQVFDAPKQVTRDGLGDIRFRFTTNLIGNPALTPAAFAQRKPATTFGVSLTTIAPTGDYNPNHLINVSSHRWASSRRSGSRNPSAIGSRMLPRVLVLHQQPRFLRRPCTWRGTGLGPSGAWRLQLSPRPLASGGPRALFRRRHHSRWDQQARLRIGYARRCHALGAAREGLLGKSGLVHLAERARERRIREPELQPTVSLVRSLDFGPNARL